MEAKKLETSKYCVFRIPSDPEDLYLRIPILWNHEKKMYFSRIFIPNTDFKVDCFSYRVNTVFSLVQDQINEIFNQESELSEKLADMFMPDFYWE